MQQFSQNTARILAGVPDHWKGLYGYSHIWVGQKKERRRKRRVSAREAEAKERFPHPEESVGTEMKAFEAVRG